VKANKEQCTLVTFEVYLIYNIVAPLVLKREKKAFESKRDALKNLEDAIERCKEFVEKCDDMKWITRFFFASSHNDDCDSLLGALRNARDGLQFA
jgi:hypothetical protein